MNQSEILQELNIIFIDVMDNKTININRQTNALDIDEWDSLTHVQLIVAIEKHFKIKFSSLEIRELKNVGHLCDLVEKKTPL
jgi:acyl carrier protein